MTKAFMHKVINNGVVDTRKYRYRLVTTNNRGIIERIALNNLDTTAAINAWERVRVVWATL